MYHQFDPQNDHTSLCRKASNSVEIYKFLLQKEENSQGNLLSLRHVNTLQEITVLNFVIIERNDIRHLAQVMDINVIEENLIIQSYKAPFPTESHHTTLVKLGKRRMLISKML